MGISYGEAQKFVGEANDAALAFDDIMVSGPYSIIPGCMDSISPNYDSTATINVGCIYVNGCMNPLAENYNPWANVDDGSCSGTTFTV